MNIYEVIYAVNVDEYESMLQWQLLYMLPWQLPYINRGYPGLYPSGLYIEPVRCPVDAGDNRR